MQSSIISELRLRTCPDLDYRKHRDELLEALVREALRRYPGNRAWAARSLKMSRGQLYRLAEKYDIF